MQSDIHRITRKMNKTSTFDAFRKYEAIYYATESRRIKMKNWKSCKLQAAKWQRAREVDEKEQIREKENEQHKRQN